MPDFPEVPALGSQHIWSIHTWSENALSGAFLQSAPSGIAWPAANRALLIPFRLPVRATVYKMGCGTGTLTTGNFDLGIYDVNGNRLVSTGATAKTTASSERIVDVTDTQLMPGMYYLAMSTDGTQNYFGTAVGSAPICQLLGLREVDAGYVLPATVTFETYSSATLIPLVSAFLRSEV